MPAALIEARHCYFVIGIISLAVCIAALGFGFDLLERWYAKHLEDKRHHHSPDYKARRSYPRQTDNRVVIARLDAVAEQLDAYRREQQRADTHRSLREIFVIVVGVVAAGFAGWSAWIFYSQLREMRDARRPLMSLEVEPASALEYSESSVSVSFRLTLQNVGDSAAIDVNAITNIIVDKTPNINLFTRNISLRDPFDTLKKHCDKVTTLLHSDCNAFGNVIFPRATFKSDPESTMADIPNIPPPSPSRFPGPLSTLENLIPSPLPPLVNQIMVVACVDYRAIGDSQRHQTGEVYWLTRKLPANSQGWSDIDPNDRQTVPADGLSLRKAGIMNFFYTPYVN